MGCGGGNYLATKHNSWIESDHYLAFVVTQWTVLKKRCCMQWTVFSKTLHCVTTVFSKTFFFQKLFTASRWFFQKPLTALRLLFQKRLFSNTVKCTTTFFAKTVHYVTTASSKTVFHKPFAALWRGNYSATKNNSWVESDHCLATRVHVKCSTWSNDSLKSS